MQSVFKRVSYLILVLLFGCGSNVHVGLGQVSHAQENDTVDAPVRFQPIVFDIPPQAANATFIQDRDGFFWIGTQVGLVKWDGMHATLYTKANSGISDPIVTKILEGQDTIVYL